MCRDWNKCILQQGILVNMIQTVYMQLKLSQLTSQEISRINTLFVYIYNFLLISDFDSYLYIPDYKVGRCKNKRYG